MRQSLNPQHGNPCATISAPVSIVALNSVKWDGCHRHHLKVLPTVLIKQIQNYFRTQFCSTSIHRTVKDQITEPKLIQVYFFLSAY